MTEKLRLDVLLAQRRLAESRQKAQALIMAGQVYVAGQRETRAGRALPPDAVVEVRGDRLPYVSRGGLKLEKAVSAFGLRLAGLVAMDVGASTGGFTDCMLQQGAQRVYAVDVGYGQLAWQLRQDARVVSLERTNIRYLTPEQIPEPIAFASVDVSFISLKLVLPPLRALLSPAAQVVCLIKPQFEAGRESVGKKGVVRDPAVHLQVLQNFFTHAKESGFSVAALDYSPIRGPEGNIEYLGLLCCQPQPDTTEDLSLLVKRSHESLEGKER